MNRLSIILPAVAIALGSLFLYLGFESGTGGYVTLSIDGAFLILVGIVSIFAPRADTAEVDFLAALSKQVPGASEYFPQILGGKVQSRFTKDGKIALIGSEAASHGESGVLQVIEPLNIDLRKAVIKSQANNHKGSHRFKLTRKFERQLVDKGVLEEIGVESDDGTIVITLCRPVTGIPLFPDYREPVEAQVAVLSSRLLTTVCCLVSADIMRNTTLKGMARRGDDLIIQLGAI